jgi:hypothetical protein
MQGIYFYGDFCSGRIRGLKRSLGKWETSLLADTPFAISTFGEGEDGSHYMADYAAGTVYKVVQTAIPDLPDLSGEWISFSLARLSRLFRIDMTLTVLNKGPKQATRTSAKIYLSNDDQFDQSDLLLRGVSFGTIPPGASRTKSLRLWTRADPSGKHLIAVIDPENKIQEFDEINNIAVSNGVLQ